MTDYTPSQPDPSSSGTPTPGAGGSPPQGQGDVRGEARNVADELRNLSSAVGDAAAAKVREVRDYAAGALGRYKSQASEAAGEGVEHLREGADDLYRRGQDVLTQVEDYVRKEPVKSVLIAAGVGALLGAILKRR